MTRKDDKGDQPCGGEATWTNTGATQYGGGQFGDGMLRPTPNHGRQRLPNDDDGDDSKQLKPMKNTRCYEDRRFTMQSFGG